MLSNMDFANKNMELSLGLILRLLLVEVFMNGFIDIPFMLLMFIVLLHKSFIILLSFFNTQAKLSYKLLWVSTSQHTLILSEGHAS